MDRELETQAARLFTVGFHGKQPSQELLALIARGVAGVIFFARNVSDPAELFETTRALKCAAKRPLLTSLDQEGGPVARLKSGFSRVPAMRVVGETGKPELAHEIGALLGRELSAVGFDLNYAPVLDVDTNPNNPVIGARSFGRDPDRVSEFGLALAAGLESVGVASCGKHFPGHGDTSQDSHLDLPRLPHSLERLLQVELKPFASAARAGMPSLMSAHVVFEALDPIYPATMSRAVLHGLLRERLGYDGLLVSDDLEMRAIAGHYAIEETVVRGLNAGLDQFLCCHTAELAQRGIDAVIHAVERGAVPRETLVRANQRIEAFARRYAQAARPHADLRVLACDAHLQLIERVLESAHSAPKVAERDPTEY